MKSGTLRLSSEVNLLPRQDCNDRPAFPDPVAIWLKMVLFGAVLIAVAMGLSSGWGIVELWARTHGVPSRRTMGSAFPYITLVIVASKWMGVWAVSSLSPLVQAGAESRAKPGLAMVRIAMLRLLVTASFILFSLRLWGFIGDGLRPFFDGMRFSLITDSLEAGATILLWLHLAGLASRMAVDGMRTDGLWAGSMLVMVGRAGTLVLLFLVPLACVAVGHPLRFSWGFVNLRAALTVVWDVIAMLVLVRFAGVFLRTLARPANGRGK